MPKNCFRRFYAFDLLPTEMKTGICLMCGRIYTGEAGYTVVQLGIHSVSSYNVLFSNLKKKPQSIAKQYFEIILKYFV